MHPLAVSIKQVGTDDEITSNIRTNRARGLPEVTPALCSHDGTFVIAGSGPSLPKFVEEIRGERKAGRPILACNGAHDFLCEHELEPDLFLTIDPRDTIIANTSKKNAHTTYLIASRCSPNLFEHLKDCKVMLWHAWGTGAENDAYEGKYRIGGGTTSGTRAIYIGYVMGYRKFRIYGLDSCLASDGQTKRFSGEKAGAIWPIFVGDTKRQFLANGAMAQQAQEIQKLTEILPDATFEFLGDGLIAAIWEERKRLGMPT